MQKGGTAGLLLVVFGILVVTIGGGYWWFKEDAAEVPILASNTPVEVPTGEKNVKATRSFVILDSSFAVNGGTVYFRSGTASDGDPTYTSLPKADADSFHKVGEAGDPQSGSTQTFSAGMPQSQNNSAGTQTSLGSSIGSGAAGTSYSISFYADENNVYMLIESGGQTTTPQIVPGADPDTFQLLNAEYSKDENNVYVVIVVCSGGACSGAISIVLGADPDTFQAFPNQQSILNSDCSAYIFADGQDANNVFNNGVIVEGISVYLIGQNGECDDTPVLISP